VYRAGRDEVRFAGTLPLLPLRDVVLFPGMMALPWAAGLVAAVEHAVADDDLRGPHAARSRVGSGARLTISAPSSVTQLLHPPDGTLKLLVEGEPLPAPGPGDARKS
jgi:hypothetical protein